MPSPFPGMDPWLERESTFPNLRGSLLMYAKFALNVALPPHYFAQARYREWLDRFERTRPDAVVFAENEGAPAALTNAGFRAVDSEDRRVDVRKETHLEIRDAEREELVTAIEFVSWANKENGPARTAYLHRQDECRLEGVNLVEIDLLRGGPHTTTVPEARLRAAGAGDYHVCVSLAGSPRYYFVKPFALEDPLPTVPIPLGPNEPPIPLDLQQLFARCYDLGRFALLAKYARREPAVPLSPEQRAWAEAILREKGLLP